MNISIMSEVRGANKKDLLLGGGVQLQVLHMLLMRNLLLVLLSGPRRRRQPPITHHTMIVSLHRLPKFYTKCQSSTKLLRIFCIQSTE